MIKKWNEFFREFVESDNYIDSKMQELKDLVDGATDGNNIIYEWENKNDHELTVTFSTGELSIRYDFDIDDLHVTKTAGDKVDFSSEVESIEEGLEIIEKDIQSILGISEKVKHLNSFSSFNLIEEKKKKSYSDAKGGLDKWFKEKWVDISKTNADGSHPPCGRSDTSKGGYPKCRKVRVAARMSDKKKKASVQRKRNVEKKGEKGGNRKPNYSK